MKKVIFIFFLLLFHSCLIAQNFTKTSNGIKTEVDGIQLEIQFFNPQIARVVKSPVGFAYKKESLSVIKLPEAVALAITQNNNYNYEKGNYLEIAFHWNNAAKTLTVGNKRGNFEGMLARRKFNIDLVNENKGTGTNTTVKYYKIINYISKQVVIQL